MLSNKQIKQIKKLVAPLLYTIPKEASLYMRSTTLGTMMPDIRIVLRDLLLHGGRGCPTKEAWYYVLYPTAEKPTCYCGGRLLFKADGTGYRKYCSAACSYKSEDRSNNIRKKKNELEADPERAANRKAAYEKTSKYNWGVVHPHQSDTLRKQISTIRKDFSESKKKDILEKCRSTSNSKYGDTHYWKANRKKMSDHQNAISASPKKKEQKLQRFKDSSIAKFGTEHPMQAESVKETSRQTHLRLRGVSHPSKDPEVLSKILLSKKRRRRVEILGNVHLVQGYEHLVLKDLESRMVELRTGLKAVPKFDYYDPIGKKDRCYFPDAVIRTKMNNRCVLEVKSPYTLCYQLDTNLAKFKAARKWCKDNDWLFILAVCDAKGNISYLKSPTSKEIRALAKSFKLKVE